MIQPRPIGEIDDNSFRMTKDGSVFVPRVGTFFFAAGWNFEASIPWWLIPVIRILPLSACVQWASCIHDWLYCMKLQEFPRERCDALFAEISMLDGVSERKAWWMHWALVVGGKGPWNRITVAQSKEAAELGYFVPEGEE